MRRQLVSLVIAASLVAGSAAVAQQAEEELRETHGDWEIRCVTSSGACVMSQTGKAPAGNDVVEVRIRKLSGVTANDGSAVPAAIQILAPLGVLLPAGVRVKVDAKQVRAAPFEVCGPAGCVVRQAMSADFLAEMRAGNTAQLTMIAAPQTEVQSSISLRGFTRAFNSLQP